MKPADSPDGNISDCFTAPQRISGLGRHDCHIHCLDIFCFRMGHILRQRSVSLGHSSFLEAFYPPATLLILFSLQFRCISCSVAGFHTSARGSGPLAGSPYFFLACSSWWAVYGADSKAELLSWIVLAGPAGAVPRSYNRVNEC